MVISPRLQKLIELLRKVRREVKDAEPDELLEASRLIGHVSIEAMEGYVNTLLAQYKGENALPTVADKQRVAKEVSAYCRSVSGAILHPDDELPCVLLAINDKWGGKFVLESMVTNKRSHTTRDLATLLPLRMCELF